MISGLFYYFYKIGGDDLPAPNFSNSISFNEKIDFIRNKDLSKIQYIVIGSSMALNNVDSETMVKHLGENYLNLASWGFKISDTKLFLENMIEYFPSLEAVIISTSFMDFSSEVRNITVDYRLVKNAVKFRLGILPYILSPELKYYYNNSKTNHSKKNVKNSYQNLVYDKYGGAVLDIHADHIDPERWEKNILDFEVSDEELTSLSKLIDFLDSKSIKTVVVLAPQREGLITENSVREIYREIEKISSVTENSDAILVNSFAEDTWSDSLFVDYTHLNQRGAVLYSGIIAKTITFQP
jgi:hypothetical protein